MKRKVILYLLMMLIVFQLCFIILNIGHIYHHHEHCMTCLLIYQWNDKIDDNSFVITLFTYILFCIIKKKYCKKIN